MNGTGIGTSLILIATGAVLAFAIDYRLSGIDINAIGGILMVVGILGLLFSLIFLSDMTFMRREPMAGTHVHDNVTYDSGHVHDSTVQRTPDATVRTTQTDVTHRS